MSCGSYLHNAKEHAASNGIILVDVIAQDILEKTKNPTLKEKAMYFIETMLDSHKDSMPTKNFRDLLDELKDEPMDTLGSWLSVIIDDLKNNPEKISKENTLNIIYDKVGLAFFGKSTNDTALSNLFSIDPDRYSRSILDGEILQKNMERGEYREIIAPVFFDEKARTLFASALIAKDSKFSDSYFFERQRVEDFGNILFRQSYKSGRFESIVNGMQDFSNVKVLLGFIEDNDIRLSESDVSVLRKKVSDLGIKSIGKNFKKWEDILGMKEESANQDVA